MSETELRLRIREAQETNGGTLDDVTVLSPARDPYRLDTPANHLLGQWLLDALEQVGHDLSGSRVHLRGLHYK